MPLDSLEEICSPAEVEDAATIVSPMKRKHIYSLERNYFKRKRYQNMLYKKIRQLTYRIGKTTGLHVAALVAESGIKKPTYKVFGANPLRDIIKNLSGQIKEDLENVRVDQARSPVRDNHLLVNLPTLVIDGVLTPLTKMTQAQLISFITFMLKYSTERDQAGWGNESLKPKWWPKNIPWANVQSDSRSENEKLKVSWTKALRRIVINCYKFHGREDLLRVQKQDEKAEAVATANINTPCTSKILHTTANPHGTNSRMEVDPNDPIVTLPDESTAHLQKPATLQVGKDDGSQGHNIQFITKEGVPSEIAGLNSVTKATLNSEGQVVLTDADGHVYGVMTKIDSTVPPAVHVPKVEPKSETITI